MQTEVTDTLPKCPTGTLAAWTPAGTILAPSWCKRWACPECGRRKAHKLARRIMQTQARRFITLTVRVNPSLTALEQLDILTASWRTIWKRIKRQQGAQARGYVRIVELTKAGTPHLHLAVDCRYIPQRQLSRWWQELTGSQIVDIRAIKTTAGLSKYLAKYLTKAHQVIKHRRKWSSSHDFLPPPELTNFGTLEGQEPWTWLAASIETMLEAYKAAGALLEAPQAANGRAPPP